MQIKGTSRRVSQRTDVQNNTSRPGEDHSNRQPDITVSFLSQDLEQQRNSFAFKYGLKEYLLFAGGCIIHTFSQRVGKVGSWDSIDQLVWGQVSGWARFACE